ncbi:MAG: hypothetical protein ACJ741_19570 [Pyrinomonadaceae bacterium]
MNLSAKLTLLGCFAFICCLPTHGLAQKQANAIKPDELEGVYEFVSEKVELTKPKKVSGGRAESDWAGIWQFQKGHFTHVMMKRVREQFFDSTKLEDLGFESSAGTYEISGGGTVWLRYDIAFHPFDVGRPVAMRYQHKGDTITLTETLTPHMEDLSGGTITTALRRKR